MDLYNIPNDDGVKWRKNQFIHMMEGDYIDGATDYCLLIPFGNNLTADEKAWLCYLYGLSYSCTTAIRIFSEFDNVLTINPRLLKLYWKEHKDTLWFNPDKKYIKNNNQVIPAIQSFYKLCREYKSPYSYLQKHSSSFDALYNEIIKNWRFFGPHGTFLFFDAMYGVLPELYTDPETLNWKHMSKPVIEGMLHFRYEDDCIQTKTYNFENFNKSLNQIKRRTKKPVIQIESVLCAFRKLFKGTRYYGYYADRMLEECLSSEPYLTGCNIWGFRADTIPLHLRGEDQGWNGIRKERLNLWISKGVMYE